MSRFASLAELRTACLELPEADDAAAAVVVDRQTQLTKPPGSLGRLEDIPAWLARWQGRAMPLLDRVLVLVFAGNHGVSARGVSAFPASVTAQMVANFDAGGAAINQLCRAAGADLTVIPFDLDVPTADFTIGPAMDEAGFLAAVAAGYDAVPPDIDLLCVGEMGIGNTTVAAALSAALCGGDGRHWAGRGTGVDDEGLRRKCDTIDAGLTRHADTLADPLQAAMCLGGYELAGMFGAVLAARMHGIPVLLDGFVSTAAAAPLAKVAKGGLDHALVAHTSAEPGHRRLAEALGKAPLIDLGMRLGEASGAAVAIPILRAAVTCHAGMATFAEAGVDGKG
ncbi:nicotinate-nucleotide--dimethylbenzimidazole phosphoribosyltransferase [Microbaculum sp. FT89]|uniref:nicotinate-nucleotide--dimethylbenzimidazole phosphoribosyltransferase n=1 Tax=Microbaculum sp. FT89 TaxID=3447298 RepID=UPI003F52DF68